MSPRSTGARVSTRRLGLRDLRDAAFATLSGGERVRLLLVVALIGDPDLVVLDEPTTGLDPQARSAVWQAMLRMRGAGRTIVLTTHYLEEAEDYCDSVVLLDEGRVAARGHPEALLRESRLQTRISFPADLVDGDVTDEHCPGFTTPQVVGDVAVLFTSEKRPLDALQARISDRLRCDLTSRASIRPANLEDLFLLRTGRAYAGPAVAAGRPEKPSVRKGRRR